MKKISKVEFQEIFLEENEEDSESLQEEIDFLKVMANVKPLKDNKQADFFTLKKLKFKRQADFDFAQDISDNFKINSLSKKEISQIKGQQRAVEATLDLHGRTTAESSFLLDNFIKNSFNKGYRLVIVITGKGNNSLEKENGMGVLKSFFLYWLTQGTAMQYVVSYGEAAPLHGGSGAFYVCLRKNQKMVSIK
ncbi:MAG: Smr/MutS family protein [Alphaproteobacteria bacterium]|nr:Smr/MutS family protein [Alphaproteobacteria bacterium]